MRAEEMVLRVPDGRSVAVLLNATLVHSEDGEVETFVVTMQDMAQLEEFERLRAEFLAMVSYELRPPLATVRGSVSTLMDESSEMHPAEGRASPRQRPGELCPSGPCGLPNSRPFPRGPRPGGRRSRLR